MPPLSTESRETSRILIRIMDTRGGLDARRQIGALPGHARKMVQARLKDFLDKHVERGDTPAKGEGSQLEDGGTEENYSDISEGQLSDGDKTAAEVMTSSWLVVIA